MTRPYPMLGFVGTSGSGKTTLLEAIVARLSDRGVRVAVVKHARAGFDIDPETGKDSHRLRASGAAQVLVASRDRWALMAEQPDPLEEPSLGQMLSHLDRTAFDVVLVEGFRHERYPKVEVFRSARGRPPQCWPDDPDVVAVAGDVPMASAVPWLDINDLDEVVAFVTRRFDLPAVEWMSQPVVGGGCHE